MDEPDGSRTIGIVPPYRGQPEPPAWLRTTSHQLVAPGLTRHYQYEAYGDGMGAWMVRYVCYPEGDEAYLEIEQAFLYGADPARKPKVLKPAEVQFEPRSAKHGGKTYVLVDRRDLMQP
jgi:hypothetical protein